MSFTATALASVKQDLLQRYDLLKNIYIITTFLSKLDEFFRCVKLAHCATWSLVSLMTAEAFVQFI